MVDFDTKPKTEAEQKAFFDAAKGKFEEAVGVAGGLNHYYQVAGTTVRLRFAGERMVSLLTPALAHLRVDEAPADVTFCIWDSESTGVDMLPPPCGWDCFTDRGDIWGFNSENVKTAFHWIECSLNLMDYASRTGIFWVNEANALPFWTRASPLRTLFHWWMEHNGCQLLHAAAVGTDEGAVLITGKGGVGKSTTALACLREGWFYLADDYLIARPGPEPRVYSLYSTAKLNAKQMSGFPEFVQYVSNPEELDREKAVMYLHPHFDSSLTRELPIRAILLPRIQDREDTTVAPISEVEVQRAAAFTTMSQLPGVGQHTHARIRELVRAVPGLELQLGRDLRRIPAAILETIRDPYAAAGLGAQIRRKASTTLPLVTVVIPVYNGERFLRQAVDNIISQAYPSVEIIIVDDGSEDATPEIAKDLPVDVRYLPKENNGPAEARNWGIQDASGELIAFLDVDDLWPENNLHRLVEELLRNPEIEVVRGYAQLLRFDNRTNTYDYVGNPAESFPDYIGAALYRASAFEKVGLFDSRLRFAEDLDWFNRAREIALPIKRLEEVTLQVRRHGENMTYGRSMVELNALRVFKLSLDRQRVQDEGKAS